VLASGKADGKDDPLRELRKDLGEETPDEEEKDIEHHSISPLHVPGIPPGGGALPFGPGRPDAGSNPPAPRTASPQPSPPARPAAPGAAPTGQPPAPVTPSSPAAPRPAAPGGQAPDPGGQSLPPNATGRLKPAASVPNALAPLTNRHNASRINKDSVTKTKNTVILPGIDIQPDLQAIREGRAMRDGPYYAVNGRYYGIHEGSRIYPEQGPGLMTLDRGAFRALGIYNSLGETPDAEQRLDRAGITQDQRRAARAARGQ